jgi:hypothetical protein
MAIRTHIQAAAVSSALFAMACGPMPTGADGSAGGDAAVDGATSSEAGAPRGVFAERVVEFAPGAGAGFGQSRMPGIVLGAPEGAGDMFGSTHVVSLGRGGRICVAMSATMVDRAGADFIVFENAFFVAGVERSFVELGEVSVSDDGSTFATFACDRAAAPFRGCAGVNPVYASTSNGLDPTDPRYAGGDAFDLASVGLTRATIVCVRDLETEPQMAPSSGFDLDAVAAVHAAR